MCHPVCFKGRKNKSECRFGYPHDVVHMSCFESETNSIIFARCEADVDSHNPYIVVSTRHNHDVKCILSGKSTKAAMFYISDYITKMPLSTEELLTLLSRAVASVTEDDILETPVGCAKHLLHRCLTHFGRGTQIHAQHTVCLIQGLDDTIFSHKTVPMPSAHLLLFVCSTFPACAADSFLPVDDDLPVHISINNKRQLRESDQVHDYYYCSPELEDITFYNFIQHFSIKSKNKTTPKNTPLTRLGVLSRYPLCEEHLYSQTHELIRHTSLSKEILDPN